MFILKGIVKLIKNFPMKSIFITVIVVVLLAVGARNIYMGTGNDTLVKSSSDVYKDNLMLEKEFGGESIIILYEAEDLLTPANLSHMKGLGNVLETSNSVFSVMSPVTLIERMVGKQSDKFKEGILEIIDGLDEMGSKLSEIGDEMKNNTESNQELAFPTFEDPQLPNIVGTEIPELGETELPDLGEAQLLSIEGQMAELHKGFSNMIEAQKSLGDGTENLVAGYAEFGNQTNELGKNLSVLAEQMEEIPQQEKLKEISHGLIILSEKMTDISKETSQLPGISTQTVEGLKNIEGKLSKQLIEQQEQQEQMKKDQKQKQEQIQREQIEKKAALQSQIQNQQEKQQEEMQKDMQAQQAVKEKQMQELQEEMQGKQEEQAEKFSSLGKGLTEMGEKLQTIAGNIASVYDYSDIMTPGIPGKQATLDNMIYEDGELRPMFGDVVVDEHHMLMMIKFEGNTDDAKKSELVGRIHSYLNTEQVDGLITIVSGKPVLDDAVRTSMKDSMQKMMGLALLVMVVILFFVFKVRWRILPLVIVLVAVIGTVGLMGWLQIPITMVSMAVFPILIGLGIDYAIQFQNRYAEEMAKEDMNE